MTARYKGVLVRVETTRAYIVWRGMVKRVNKAELEDARTEGRGLRTEGSAVAT